MAFCKAVTIVINPVRLDLSARDFLTKKIVNVAEVNDVAAA